MRSFGWSGWSGWSYRKRPKMNTWQMGCKTGKLIPHYRYPSERWGLRRRCDAVI